jgi:hypothetical protein
LVTGVLQELESTGLTGLVDLDKLGLDPTLAVSYVRMNETEAGRAASQLTESVISAELSRLKAEDHCLTEMKALGRFLVCRRLVRPEHHETLVARVQNDIRILAGFTSRA